MSQGEMKKLFNDLQGSDIRFLYAYVNIRASVHVLRIHATIVVCVSCYVRCLFIMNTPSCAIFFAIDIRDTGWWNGGMEKC